MPGGRWAGSTRKARLPYGWAARIRPDVLARDPVCRLRYVGVCTYQASQVDHKSPGDDHSLSNLQGVCASCHRLKSASEGGRAAALARSRRRRVPTRHPGLIR